MNNCCVQDKLPRILVGAISSTYTVIVERKKPSPTPVIHLPTKRTGRLFAEAAKTDPTENIAPPNANVLVREIRSEMGPAAMDAREAVMRIEETTRP